MNWSKAFLAGVTGGIAMVVVLSLGRLMGMDMNLAMMLGTMILPMGAAAWVAGFIIHLIISGVIGLIYAWGFENVTHRAGVGVGMLFSILHSIATGLFMGIVPAMHPRIPEMMPAPGFFLANKGGIYVVALFVVHFIYGAIVGAMYEPVEQATARPTVA